MQNDESRMQNVRGVISSDGSRPAGRAVIRAYAALLASLVAIAGCFVPAIESPPVEFAANDVTLLAGAAAMPITPTELLPLAGGLPYRPGLTIHDSLLASAVVLQVGDRRVALVSLDLIGIDYDDVVRIRQDIAAFGANVDYALIAATHTHNAPDLIGVWAPLPLCLDPPYRHYVGQQVSRAVSLAIESLRPATIHVAQANAGDPPLNRDVRPPAFLDDAMTVWQARDAQTREPIATVVHYASHPITLNSALPAVSSDFVQYLRHCLEFGYDGDDGPVEALGGTCIYFNGAMAGKATPDRAQPLAHRNVSPSYAHAEGFGYQVARRAAMIFRQAKELRTPIALEARSRTLSLPLDNKLLRRATEWCIVDRPIRDGRITTEIGVIRVGDVEFFALPGMVFPELVYGERLTTPQADFPNAAPERPSLRELSRDRLCVPIGIANDMIGYVIPKSQWDERPPFSGGDRAPYGEAVSPGPETARLLLSAFAELVGSWPSSAPAQ